MNELPLLLIHLFVQLFNKYLLSTYYETSSIPGNEGTKMSKTGPLPLKHFHGMDRFLSISGIYKVLEENKVKND